MKYLSLLIPQTGMAHLRFHFFNQQRQEVHTSWSFLFILGFQKKSQRGGGMGWGRGTLHIFLTKIFFFLDLLLYPWKFWKNNASPLEILEICVTPLGNSTFFPYHPWILYMYILCLLYTWKFLAFTTPVFFFWNSPLHLFKLLFFKVL